MHILMIIFAILATAFPAVAGQAIGGQTVMAHVGASPQIEYIGADGRLWLWYLGNQRIVRGNWKEEGGQTCIRYEASSRDAATGRPGGKWQCMATSVYLSIFIDQVKGDVFGLERRNLVPYPLPGHFKGIAALAKSGGKVELAPTLSADACQAIVANAGKSKNAALQAGILLFHGKSMGKDCIKVDYVRAFQFIAQSGDKKNYKSLYDTLSKRAEQGNSKALAAMKKINPWPF